MSRRTLTSCVLAAMSVAATGWAQPTGVAVPDVAGGPAAAQAQPASPAVAGRTSQDRASQAQDSSWQVDVEPIYLWAPIYIGNVTAPRFPELPPPPGGADRPSGSTGASLSGAYMGAFRIAKNRWVLGANVVWAGLSAEKERPYLKTSGNLVYGDILTGVRVVNQLYVEGGVRRLAVKVTAQVLDYPEVSRKPDVWDPVIGLSYRLPMGKHFLLTLHGDGGGFGVGTDVDVLGRAVLDWRATRHFGMTFGYQILYVRLDDTILDSTRLERTLSLGASLGGPIVGFKLRF